MRNAFIRAITRRAAADPDLILLTADNGAIVFDDFRARFPRQFINAGISEQNMVGVSAGLALAGYHPVLYTIIPFLILRAAEQIRTDVCLQHLPVLIAGIGAGVSYYALGPTHHAYEDLALTRALPGLTVIVPADPPQVESAVAAAAALPGPVYLRLGLGNVPTLPARSTAFAPGKGELLRTGDTGTFFACGRLVDSALQAATVLANRGIQAAVVNLHTLKPLDAPLIQQRLAVSPLAITVEEHHINGGLGSAVAECAAEAGLAISLRRCGLPEHCLTFAGDHRSLLAASGLLPDNLAAAFLAMGNFSPMSPGQPGSGQ